jgi:hypothetical protein
MTLAPEHFALLMFVIAPAVILGAAAIGALQHRTRDDDNE